MTSAWGDDGRDDLPEVEEREAPAKRFFYTRSAGGCVDDQAFRDALPEYSLSSARCV